MSSCVSAAAAHARRWRPGDTFLFCGFLSSTAAHFQHEIGVKSLCTLLMLPAEEVACSAQRGEQVQAAAMPSASPPPNQPFPLLPQPPLFTPSLGGEPTAGAAAERSFNILSSLC